VAKIVILGAGLTGLSTAYHLEKNNFFDFTIFERESTHGGLCRSVKHDGFTFDYTGHLLHCNNTYFQTVLNEILPPTTRNTLARKSYIHSHNHFVPYPFQMNLHGLPTEVIAECICSFAKRNHQHNNPQSFHEWVLKYFGTGIAKHFFFPYNQKLLQYNLKKIHPSWTGRFVPKTTIKNLFTGLANQENNSVGYNHTFLYPKQGGIQTFTDNLRKKITCSIKTNYNATNIDLKKKIVSFDNGHTEKFDTLITTIPLKNLLQNSTQPSSCNIKKNHRYLRCNAVVNFNVGFKGTSIDKHWIYFPEKKYPFYRVGFWHNFSKSLVRPEHGALYGELAYLPGQLREKELNQRVEKSIEQSCQIFGLSKNKNIVSQKILHLPNAYVIYDHWREKNLPALHKALRDHSVYSIGRYGAWNYSSMQDAILDGQKIATKLLHQFIPAQIYKKKREKKKKERSSEAHAIVL